MKLFLTLLLTLIPVPAAFAQATAPSAPPQKVEQWGIYEVTLKGPAEGNPFIDVDLSARFTSGQDKLDVPGFYDGDGTYRVRFMPPAQGAWHYITHANRPELDAKSGDLVAIAPAPGNHGPVQVAHTFHFAYADGSPYVQVGTTCYAWIHQGDTLEEQTLATLKTAPFNKLRMCVFPKRYAYNTNEPVLYPYEGTPPNHWDFTRFNPAFFQHLEKRIGQLRDMEGGGIEADLILFHPYDRGHWGFDSMPSDADDRYLRYIVARLAAYRNVWWSMANEFDFMKAKTDADWDRFFAIVAATDPYHHLRSIHNGGRMYNHTSPLVTHASIQNGEAVEDFYRATLYREIYRKPVVMDEVKYEGNIDQRWGQLSPEEMVYRFWIGTVGGVYVGHGETYMDPPPAGHDILWWSKGGVLHGQSPSRIAFLRKILEAAPAEGLDPIDIWEDTRLAGQAGRYYLLYFGKAAPKDWTFELPARGLKPGTKMKVDILDTWNMTVTPAPDTYTLSAFSRYRLHAEKDATVQLPGRPYIALRITPAE